MLSSAYCHASRGAGAPRVHAEQEVAHGDQRAPYGWIPEAVPMVTVVTSGRPPRRTALGHGYQYRHVRGAVPAHRGESAAPARGRQAGRAIEVAGGRVGLIRIALDGTGGTVVSTT